MAGVEQNRYKTNNGCIKHLPQTGFTVAVWNFPSHSSNSDLSCLLYKMFSYLRDRSVVVTSSDDATVKRYSLVQPGR